MFKFTSEEVKTAEHDLNRFNWLARDVDNVLKLFIFEPYKKRGRFFNNRLEMLVGHQAGVTITIEISQSEYPSLPCGEFVSLWEVKNEYTDKI